MSAKRVLCVVLVASAVMLAMGVGPWVAGSAHVLPPVQEPDPAGVTVPYPGRLDDEEGQPVADGAYDFTFALYEAETSGEPLWSEVQEGVAVKGGAFVTLLGSVNSIPAALLDGHERWLAVSVRGPGEADFTTLIPRQRLSAASARASATSVQAATNGTCPHDHFGEQWIGTGSDGLLVSTNNWVALEGWSDNYIGVAGIQSPYGFAWPSGHQDGVFGHSSSGHGVYGETTGDWGNRSGVYGLAVNNNAHGVTGWNTSAGPGVYGRSASGNGVYGYSEGSGNGVYGYSASGYGVYGYSASSYAGYFNGQVYVVGYLWKPGGGFKIDHPLDPENQYLNHSFVESPDMKNVYDGVVELDANGEAWVELPTWFEALNKDFRYQLTPIGAPGPNLYIAQEIQNNRFQIAGGRPGMKVSWQVTGIRHDPYAEAHPIPVEDEKPPEERGTYLYPVEHGMPETSGLNYQWNQDLEQSEAGGGR